MNTTTAAAPAKASTHAVSGNLSNWPGGPAWFVCVLLVFDENAYGMYLVHYAFVSCLQYALLPASPPGFVKGMRVTFGAIPSELGNNGPLSAASPPSPA